MKNDALYNDLGIDYGEVNIGLAIGNNGLVSPLKIISNKNPGTAMHEIGKVVVENKIGTLILGLPLSPDGKENKQSLKIRKFAKNLKTVVKRPIIFQNEFNSSMDALEEAIDINIPKKKRKTNDHLAAAIILKRYYNEKEK
jgi:putative Holliday junction resolvase